MSSPLKVGITGGIGTGKTTVAKMFNLLGVAVYDADTHAKRLMEWDSTLVASIKEEFGSDVYKDGKLDRQYLAKAVFNNKGKLARLNKFVHPAVARDFEQWVAASSAPYILKEAALLLETGSYKMLDYLLLVTSPMPLRIDRIKKRDPQRSTRQIQDIINKQMDPDKAKKLANGIIQNDEKVLLIPQVLELHNYLLKKG